MAFPASFYKDPATGAVDTLERINRWEKREKYGCKACVNHREACDRDYCDILEKPGPRGFCKKWSGNHEKVQGV